MKDHLEVIELMALEGHAVPYLGADDDGHK